MTFRLASCRLITLVLACALAACEGGSTPPPATHLPAPDDIAAVPLGQPAGMTGPATGAISTANPYAGSPEAITAGKALYIHMNCAGCHAYNGKGNMGPDLTDTYWRYGGLPIQIYKSIQDGRPQGMPGWGAALPPQEIWKLVAFIQSLGGSVPVSEYSHARQGDVSAGKVAQELATPASSRPHGPR
ncbi:MAG: c-type cytochrome [Rhodanobacter sp.]